MGDLAGDPALGPLGRALARSESSGASVADTVARLSEDLGRNHRAEVEDLARSVGVKAAVPLGVCLLPAFLLVGIVPVVVASLGRARLVSASGRAAGPSPDDPVFVHRRAFADPSSTGGHRTHRDRGSSARGWFRRAATAAATQGRARPGRGGHMHESDEAGITTAEYAVGTAAGAGLAGVLYQLVTGGFGDAMLRQMFQHVLGMLGIG